jgi:hypothetical protein
MTRTTDPDPEHPRIAGAPRELDSRTSDGIHVQLLWHPRDGHVSVAVNDSKTGEIFELEVRHGHRALDVFHHPFAYSAEPRDRERLPAQSAHCPLEVNHEFGSSI